MLTFLIRGHLKVARIVSRQVHQYQVTCLKEQLASCGPGVDFKGRFTISGQRELHIGTNVHIGDNAYIRADAGLTIGDNTHISRNLVLYTINHQYQGTCLPYDEDIIEKPVRIGKNVWIGMNVCIAPGTVIGDGAIIGMGAVVSGEVPPMAIIGSAPWRVLKHRDPQHYERLEAEKRYGGANGRPWTS